MTRITPEDLVRYLYNETSEKKTATIQAALQTDWNLRENYNKLLNSHKNLDSIHFSPRRQSVNNILEYAAKKHAQVTSH
ncbi:MAG TPA: hypothetical protein VFT78_02680 [Hanamia sp.]|jgi:hypothetical protein|nr:hypothetical protein [Hanamia sp.]